MLPTNSTPDIRGAGEKGREREEEYDRKGNDAGFEDVNDGWNRHAEEESGEEGEAMCEPSFSSGHCSGFAKSSSVAGVMHTLCIAHSLGCAALSQAAVEDADEMADITTPESGEEEEAEDDDDVECEEQDEKIEIVDEEEHGDKMKEEDGSTEEES